MCLSNQSQVAEYKALFGAAAAAEMLAAVPQLLTMSSESVKARHELLRDLAGASPVWAGQLSDAPPSLLGAWLTSR